MRAVYEADRGGRGSTPLAAIDGAGVISYANNLEDVLLVRALGYLPTGFWIDVGACHPIFGSLTKTFYDRGWRGINVEPLPLSGVNFGVERPRDVNIDSVVGDDEGVAVIHHIIGTCFSTTVREQAERWQKFLQNELQVRSTTLRSICKAHVQPDQEIHFLTIDVEGGEGAVLKGADFSRWRPWIVVVEATQPCTSVPTHSSWEPILTRAGYDFVFFDGCNRWYTAREHSELRLALIFPADSYERVLDAAARNAMEKELTETRSMRASS